MDGDLSPGDAAGPAFAGLQLAAPIVLAYGFAPGPRKRPDAEQVALQAALEAVHAEIEKLQAALRKVKRRKNGRTLPQADTTDHDRRCRDLAETQGILIRTPARPVRPGFFRFWPTFAAFGP